MMNTLVITPLAAMLSLSACNNAIECPPVDLSLSDGGQVAANLGITSRKAVEQDESAGTETATLSAAIPDGRSISVADQERASLGVLNAMNAHAIAAANQALSEGVEGKVADYSLKMIGEHTRNPALPNKKKNEMELQSLASLAILIRKPMAKPWQVIARSDLPARTAG